MKYEENGCWWMHSWRWDIGDMEGRIELNPLSLAAGAMLGPLGMRIDFLFIGFGLVWGPRFNTEEHEREALKQLKRKYEK